jgi:hypothetical protein
MRLVKVKAPEGKGADVARLALQAGIKQAGSYTEYVHGPNKNSDVVDVQTSTPLAKKFIDALTSAPFFDPREYSIAVRQPRSVVSGERPLELTRPVVVPETDIYEELWQFSQVTYSFVGRFLIAAMLIAYGLIEHSLLVMIAGLMFMPLLPLLLAISFGAWTREWRLAAQGAFALAAALVIALAGGAAVAAVSEPPVKFQDFAPLPVGLVISLGVGVAAGLATADDVGRRELIGLAATAQIALLPVWFGVYLVFGFPALDPTPPAKRLLALGLNVTAILLAALATYALQGMRCETVNRYADGAAGES